MFVCITEKGTDPGGCLLLETSDKAKIDKILASPLPWCRGPFTDTKAREMQQSFTEKGGKAETKADCKTCKKPAALRDLGPAILLLEQNQDPRTAMLTRVARGPEGTDDEDDADGRAAKTWAAALRSQIAKVQPVVANVRRDLRKAANLRLAAAVISGLAVSSLLALIIGSEQMKAFKIAIGVIAVIAAWLTALADLKARNDSGGLRAKQLEELIRLHAEAETLATKIEIFAESKPDKRKELEPGVLDRAREMIEQFIKTAGA